MRPNVSSLSAARLLVGVATTFVMLPACAQYPTRPVTMIVPFTVGTSMDTLARTLGQKLTEQWGQAVIVENKAGASGNLGTEIAAKANPDGHTLLVTGTSFAINRAINKELRYDAVKSFAPIIQIASTTICLVVSQGTPAQSVRQLVDLAKTRPGELNYGSPGNGTLHHLTMELFKYDTGINVTHIPYKGTGGAINDIVGGRLNVMFMPITVALPLVRQDRPAVRVLAVLAPERSPLFPHVPTMKEAGFPNVHTEFWFGLLAPAGTPEPIVAKLNAEVNALLQMPSVREVLDKQGMSPIGGSSARFAEHIKTEIAHWTRVVSATNIRAD